MKLSKNKIKKLYKSKKQSAKKRNLKKMKKYKSPKKKFSKKKRGGKNLRAKTFKRKYRMVGGEEGIEVNSKLMFSITDNFFKEMAKNASANPTTIILSSNNYSYGPTNTVDIAVMLTERKKYHRPLVSSQLKNVKHIYPSVLGGHLIEIFEHKTSGLIDILNDTSQEYPRYNKLKELFVLNTNATLGVIRSSDKGNIFKNGFCGTFDKKAQIIPFYTQRQENEKNIDNYFLFHLLHEKLKNVDDTNDDNPMTIRSVLLNDLGKDSIDTITNDKYSEKCDTDKQFEPFFKFRTYCNTTGNNLFHLAANERHENTFIFKSLNIYSTDEDYINKIALTGHNEFDNGITNISKMLVSKNKKCETPLHTLFSKKANELDNLFNILVPVFKPTTDLSFALIDYNDDTNVQERVKEDNMNILKSIIPIIDLKNNDLLKSGTYYSTITGDASKINYEDKFNKHIEKNNFQKTICQLIWGNPKINTLDNNITKKFTTYLTENNFELTDTQKELFTPELIRDIINIKGTYTDDKIFKEDITNSLLNKEKPTGIIVNLYDIFIKLKGIIITQGNTNMDGLVEKFVDILVSYKDYYVDSNELVFLNRHKHYQYKSITDNTIYPFTILQTLLYANLDKVPKNSNNPKYRIDKKENYEKKVENYRRCLMFIFYCLKSSGQWTVANLRTYYKSSEYPMMECMLNQLLRIGIHYNVPEAFLLLDQFLTASGVMLGGNKEWEDIITLNNAIETKYNWILMAFIQIYIPFIFDFAANKISGEMITLWETTKNDVKKDKQHIPSMINYKEIDYTTYQAAFPGVEKILLTYLTKKKKDMKNNKSLAIITEKPINNIFQDVVFKKLKEIANQPDVGQDIATLIATLKATLEEILDLHIFNDEMLLNEYFFDELLLGLHNDDDDTETGYNIIDFLLKNKDITTQLIENTSSTYITEKHKKIQDSTAVQGNISVISTSGGSPPLLEGGFDEASSLQGDTVDLIGGNMEENNDEEDDGNNEHNDKDDNESLEGGNKDDDNESLEGGNKDKDDKESLEGGNKDEDDNEVHGGNNDEDGNVPSQKGGVWPFGTDTDAKNKHKAITEQLQNQRRYFELLFISSNNPKFEDRNDKKILNKISGELTESIQDPKYIEYIQSDKGKREREDEIKVIENEVGNKKDQKKQIQNATEANTNSNSDAEQNNSATSFLSSLFSSANGFPGSKVPKDELTLNMNLKVDENGNVEIKDMKAYVGNEQTATDAVNEIVDNIREREKIKLTNESNTEDAFNTNEEGTGDGTDRHPQTAAF